MKLVLLLAAIYSLIIYHSRKNAREMVAPPVQKTMTTAANFVKDFQPRVNSRSLTLQSPQLSNSILNTARFTGSIIAFP